MNVLLDAGFKTWLAVDPRGLGDEKVRTEWLEKKNMKDLSFRKDDDKVDLIFSTPLRYEDLAREEKKAGRFIYPVPSKEDLIRLKEGTGRDTDAMDIKRLKILIELEKKNGQS